MRQYKYKIISSCSSIYPSKLPAYSGNLTRHLGRSYLYLYDKRFINWLARFYQFKEQQNYSEEIAAQFLIYFFSVSRNIKVTPFKNKIRPDLSQIKSSRERIIINDFSVPGVDPRLSDPANILLMLLNLK